MRRAALALLLISAGAHANPQGGTVVSGAATISVSGKTLTVNQTTERAIVHWQRFENTASETIRFHQPQVTSVTLNRVVGVDPTLISGALQSNGQLFLLNPNGIVFGSTARVNVGGLVASTLGISDADFLAGRYILLQDPALELSSVINRGSITAAQGGTVALIAPIVDNSGSIVAIAGRVILRADTHAAIDTRDPNVGTQGPEGRGVRMAEVGLTPLLEDVVNTTSVATADKIVRLGDGTVFLRGAGAVVANGGTINVDGTASVDAGSVEISARQGIGLAPGGTISAVAPAPREASGVVRMNSEIRDTFLARPTLSGRHVTQAGFVEAKTQLQMRSNAAGGLTFGGGTVNLEAHRGLGSASAPVRVNARSATLFAEAPLEVVSDGDLLIDKVLGQGRVGLTAVGSILVAPGAVGFGGTTEPLGAGSPITVHVVGSQVFLVAGNRVGAAADPLVAAPSDGFPLQVTAPGGQNVVTAFFQVVFPPTDTTIGLVDTVPAPRSTYVPPEDPPEALPAPGLPAGPVAVVSGGALDAVIAVQPAQPVVSNSQPATVGGRDNILLSTLRANTVKNSDDAPATSSEEVVVVHDDDEMKRRQGR